MTPFYIHQRINQRRNFIRAYHIIHLPILELVGLWFFALILNEIMAVQFAACTV